MVKMEKTVALEAAHRIAKAIFDAVLADGVGEIYEILVYGSLARSESTQVNDIDLMILDDGIISDWFKPPVMVHSRDDWYKDLRDNLRTLLVEICESPEKELRDILDIPCDLHAFPIGMLDHPGVRQKIANQHRDPKFLQNAFRHMLRYDFNAQQFVPCDLTYFENKYAQYNVKLDDLRR